ncbi:MAG: TIGR02217 family protein [Sphingomonadales bacterium]|nr:MAG: TIGR02217 family protein [Sphingomonadales bacterium]
MGWWLASERRGQIDSVVSRFDPAFWTVNFPRPMMAAVTTTAHDALRVDAVFYRADQIGGLIWEAEDVHDHPLLSYETSRDFRGCRLRFRWRSSGLLGLDAINGPVLTIEGRDAAGAARAWYVRLWNYAEGSSEDAIVSIDFAAVEGGFLLPGEADPVWAGDVDRMFVSLVPEGYSGADAALGSLVEAWAELSDIICEGPGAVLGIGDVVVPAHGLQIANGYDDCYHLTPARLLRNIVQLGYRGSILHYVGMSHYFRLDDGFVRIGDSALNVACAAWHRDFAERAKALGFSVIWSLSYELFDAHCWGDWKQRAADGSPALTGWEPPSALLSPAHEGAMAYLHAVALGFCGIAAEAGLAVRFQIGEPWWWTLPDGSLCIHDAAVDGRDPGALLAGSTLALRDAVKSAHAGAEILLLVYLPTVELNPDANMPLGWAAPAFDVLQLEDYDWAAAGNVAAGERGLGLAEARLGYPVGAQHYLSGFVLAAEGRAAWLHIDAAAERARGRGVAETFVWALPQVLRDGFVHFDQESDVEAFDDVLFPIALGREAEVAPEVSTAIVTSASGAEARNAEWAEARTHYDVGPGVRSEADISALLGFFRARMGPARGFRLRDPFDWQGEDEVLGVGDGTASAFQLVRSYGGVTRRITRPVSGTVRVSVGGVETEAFALGAGGLVTLDLPPADGAEVTASFVFDVPVRFAEDRLTVSRATFLAGAAASVPLVEVREGF